MTHITLPISIPATRARLFRIVLFLGIIALCVSAAAAKIERYRTTGPDFDARSFSSDFLD